jgi:hypothetical protein
VPLSGCRSTRSRVASVLQTWTEGLVGGLSGGPSARHTGVMCRSIKTLREPFTSDVTEDEVHAAALQYVRKISGFRAPAAHNAAAFDHAVAAVTAATQELLDNLVVRSGPTRAAS